jgi:hypothetical protein
MKTRISAIIAICVLAVATPAFGKNQKGDGGDNQSTNEEVTPPKTDGDSGTKQVADAGKHALKIQGKVVQVVKEGIILRVAPWEGRTKGRPPLLLGGSDYIFVAGHSRQDGKVEGDMIDVNAYPDGVFSYTNTLGAGHRLKRYHVTKTFR